MNAADPATPMSWTPPPGPDAELTEAGVWWDAVRVPGYLGDRVLERLGDAGGAVIRDPQAHRLHWLVTPGAADGWRIPDVAGVHVLGAASWVSVPPAGRLCSAGPHWAVPVTAGCGLTDADLLHRALAGVVAEALGPRAPLTR